MSPASKSNTSDSAGSLAYRPEVDGIRAVAVLGVIVFHLGFAWLPSGYLGVDVFFVISGYLITSLILTQAADHRFRFATFYLRRIRRLTPAIVTVLLITLFGAYFILYESELRNLGIQCISVLLLSSNLQMLRNLADYWAHATEDLALLHTWSLSVEEQFYLFFPPLLIWLSNRIPGRRSGVLLILGLGSLALNAWLQLSHPIAAFYILPTRAWELLAGCTLASLAHERAGTRPIRAVRELGLGGLGIVLGSFLFPRASTPVGSLLPIATAVLGTLLLIQNARPNDQMAGRWLSNPGVVGIGRFSYSLYLWHWPVISLYNYGIFPRSPTLLDRCAQSSIFLILASLCYHFVETPLRFSTSISARRLLQSLALAFVAVIGISVFFKRSPSLAQHNQLIANPRTEWVAIAERANEQDLRAGRAPILNTGEPGIPSICLIGSSHGAMWAAAVARISADEHLPAFSLCRDGSLGHFEHDGAEFDTLRRTELRRRKPAAIIFADPWTKYAEHPEWLRGALQELLRHSSRVLVMEQPPLATDLSSNLVKTLNGLARMQPAPFKIRESPEDRQAREAGHRMLSSIANEFSGAVRLVPTADLFLNTDGSVRVLHDSKTLYRDYSHLCDTGALLVAERIRTAIH
jgi:peptidoglycan/LPS O-acetylase OafA/YrhL